MFLSLVFVKNTYMCTKDEIILTISYQLVDEIFVVSDSFLVHAPAQLSILGTIKS